jgi:hypothetical protein
MKSIHSKAFLDTWRMVYGATNPRQDTDRWRVKDVEWSRESHSYAGRDYSYRIDVHNLRRMQGGKIAWSLLVVQERWWDKHAQGALRVFEWRRTLSGRDRDVLAWFAAQRVDFETRKHDVD